MHLLCLRKNKEASMAGMEEERRREVRDKLEDVMRAGLIGLVVYSNDFDFLLREI